MVKLINTGASPNDGTGDTLRVAFNKINNNIRTKLQEDLRLFVATENIASDDTPWQEVSIAKPLRTIKKAFDIIEQDLDLNGYKVYVHLFGGDYSSEGILHLPSFVSHARETCLSGELEEPRTPERGPVIADEFLFSIQNAHIIISTYNQYHNTTEGDFAGYVPSYTVAGFELDHYGMVYIEGIDIFPRNNNDTFIKSSRGGIIILDTIKYGRIKTNLNLFHADQAGQIYLKGSHTLVNSYDEALATTFTATYNSYIGSLRGASIVTNDNYFATATFINASRSSTVDIPSLIFSSSFSGLVWGSINIENSHVYVPNNFYQNINPNFTGSFGVYNSTIQKVSNDILSLQQATFEKLDQDLTLYVNSYTGSEEAVGTKLEPFLTIENALNYAASRYHLNGNRIIIRVKGAFTIEKRILLPEFIGSSSSFAHDILIDGHDENVEGDGSPRATLTLDLSDDVFRSQHNKTRYCLRDFVVVSIQANNFYTVSNNSGADIRNVKFRGTFNKYLFNCFNSSSINLKDLSLEGSVTAAGFCSISNSSIYNMFGTVLTIPNLNTFTATECFLRSFTNGVFYFQNPDNAFNVEGNAVGKKYRISNLSVLEYIENEDQILGDQPGEVFALNVGNSNYVNTTSGLTSNTIQDAIDEVVSVLNTAENNAVLNIQGAFSDDTDAGNNGVTTGQYYQTNGTGASPLNVPGILMVKQ